MKKQIKLFKKSASYLSILALTACGRGDNRMLRNIFTAGAGVNKIFNTKVHPGAPFAYQSIIDGHAYKHKNAVVNHAPSLVPPCKNIIDVEAIQKARECVTPLCSMSNDQGLLAANTALRRAAIDYQKLLIDQRKLSDESTYVAAVTMANILAIQDKKMSKNKRKSIENSMLVPLQEINKSQKKIKQQILTADKEMLKARQGVLIAEAAQLKKLSSPKLQPGCKKAYVKEWAASMASKEMDAALYKSILAAPKDALRIFNEGESKKNARAKELENEVISGSKNAYLIKMAYITSASNHVPYTVFYTGASGRHSV